jgi:tight adherence protein C
MTSEIILAVVGVFVAVATGVATLVWWWSTTTSVEHRRVRSLVAASPSGLVSSQPTLLAGGAPVELPWARWMAPDPKKMSRLQKRMARSGFTSSRAVQIFIVAEIALPIAFGVIALIALGIRQGMLIAFAAAAMGYVAPGLYVDRQAKARQKAIRNGLPDGLDLLTVCVEAGSALDQAVAKAGDELRASHPALAEEFRAITTEIRAGKPRLAAFQGFAERTALDEVRALVSMLTQTDRFGTSIGQALRVQSDTSRTKRRQAAEERAAKVGVKLVFPLVLCLFPALYVVCFGPVVVNVYHIFFEGQ